MFSSDCGPKVFLLHAVCGSVGPSKITTLADWWPRMSSSSARASGSESRPHHALAPISTEFCSSSIHSHMSWLTPTTTTATTGSVVAKPHASNRCTGPYCEGVLSGVSGKTVFFGGHGILPGWKTLELLELVLPLCLACRLARAGGFEGNSAPDWVACWNLFESHPLKLGTPPRRNWKRRGQNRSNAKLLNQGFYREVYHSLTLGRRYLMLV